MRLKTVLNYVVVIKIGSTKCVYRALGSIEIVLEVVFKDLPYSLGSMENPQGVWEIPGYYAYSPVSMHTNTGLCILTGEYAY